MFLSHFNDRRGNDLLHDDIVHSASNFSSAHVNRLSIAEKNFESLLELGEQLITVIIIVVHRLRWLWPRRSDVHTNVDVACLAQGSRCKCGKNS